MAPLSHTRIDDSVRPILKEAGCAILAMYRSVTMEKKFDGSAVCEADRLSESIIVSQIAMHFPNDAVISEEGESRQGGCMCWVIDPLDGTSAFGEGLAHWGPTIGRVQGDQIHYGALWLPIIGDYFHIENGCAYLNDIPLPHLSSSPPSTNSVIYLPSRFHQRAWTRWPGKCRNLGSIAAHLCLVATGAAQAVIVPGGWSLWDIAAGLAAIRSTGGHAATFDGQSLKLDTEHRLPFVAGARSAVNWITDPNNCGIISEDATSPRSR